MWTIIKYYFCLIYLVLFICHVHAKMVNINYAGTIVCNVRGINLTGSGFQAVLDIHNVTEIVYNV